MAALWSRALVAAAVTLAGWGATAVPAAADAPSQQIGFGASEGTDGVRLSWAIFPGGTGQIDGFHVQRATGDDPLATVADVPAVGTDGTGYNTWFDATAAGGTSYRYRVVAYNVDGESAPSTTLTVPVPVAVDPGPTTALVLDGPPPPAPSSYSVDGAWTGGVLFETLERTDYAGTVYWHASSTADSPQGPRDVWFTSPSTGPDGRRIASGGTYPLSPAPRYASCNGTSSMTVGEASYTSDGTPQVLDATFDWCGAIHGRILWHAHAPLPPSIMTSNKTQVWLGTTPTGQSATPATVTFRNAGTADQNLGTARAVVFNGTDPSTEFAIDTDGCSGTTLHAGGTCTITVDATPSANGVRMGRLLLPDSTDVGGRSIQLRVDAVGKTVAPTLTSRGSFHSAELQWIEPGGGGGAGTVPTKYNIYRGISGGPLTPIGEAGPAKDFYGTKIASYTDRTAEPAFTYDYAVSAVNPYGESPRSNIGTVKPTPTGILFTSASWTPSGPDRQIQVVPDTIGGYISTVTADSGDHQTPELSRDGSLLAYSSNHGNAADDYDLWIMPLGGTPRRVQADPGTNDREPAFSPDGTMLAFTRVSGTSSSVWTVPVAGGTPRMVPGLTGHRSPAWSPNGRVIACLGPANPPYGSATLVLASPDGLSRSTVANLGGDVTDLSFNPDGTQLSIGIASGYYAGVLQMDSGTGSYINRTGMASTIYSQQWSPDGKRILFAGRINGSPGFYALDAQDTTAAAGGHTALSPSGEFHDIAVAQPAAPYVAPAGPTPVDGVRTTAIGPGRAQISWNDPSNGSLIVVRRSGPGGPAPTGPEDGYPVLRGVDATTVTTTGLQNGAVYQFSVFVLSPWGAASKPSTTTAQPAAVPSGLAPNGPVLTGTTSFTATWGPRLPAGQTYQVQIGTRTPDRTGTRRDAVWSTLSSGVATSAKVQGKAGVTYYLRARIRDASGAATAWSTPALATLPWDDRSFTTHKTGWSALDGRPGTYLGTLRTSSTKGAFLRIDTVYATQLRLIVDKCPTCGKIRISLDGNPDVIVDTYAKTTLHQQIAWTARFNHYGGHLLSIEVLGTKGRPQVRIDGLAARL